MQCVNSVFERWYMVSPTAFGENFVTADVALHENCNIFSLRIISAQLVGVNALDHRHLLNNFAITMNSNWFSCYSARDLGAIWSASTRKTAFVVSGQAKWCNNVSLSFRVRMFVPDRVMYRHLCNFYIKRNWSSRSLPWKLNRQYIATHRRWQCTISSSSAINRNHTVFVVPPLFVCFCFCDYASEEKLCPKRRNLIRKLIVIASGKCSSSSFKIFHFLCRVYCGNVEMLTQSYRNELLSLIPQSTFGLRFGRKGTSAQLNTNTKNNEWSEAHEVTRFSISLSNNVVRSYVVRL